LLYLSEKPCDSSACTDQEISFPLPAAGAIDDLVSY
jgi:hypothetical protein